MIQIRKNRNFNALNLPFENVIIAGRLKCCGMEDRTFVAYGCQKTKKLICGMEGKMLWLMAAHLSPLPLGFLKISWCTLLHFQKSILY